ncbi:MAG TPA: magnesium transporter CorA family protein [Bryobacteraceae bacterium]|nr:magnesium transporter CorA family protein [Bryobacteraceae bacterium]
MKWHDIRDPKDPLLDSLAATHNLHQLHVEDCRNRRQAAKVEAQNGYLFIVLKPVEMDEEYCLRIADFDFFIGDNWLITVDEEQCPSSTRALEYARRAEGKARADQLFYRVLDAIVDSYQPIIDRVSERIDEMEDLALTDPGPDMLEEIFDLKRVLVQLRRVVANTRDVVGHLLRSDFELVHKDMSPFLRDVYDHLIRDLDLIEVHRDLLNGATELYLSSVANRTNQAMKLLTVFGTVATPALVITGIYGMNLQHLPFANAPHSFGIVIGIIALCSALTLAVMRKMRMW